MSNSILTGYMFIDLLDAYILAEKAFNSGVYKLNMLEGYWLGVFPECYLKKGQDRKEMVRDLSWKEINNNLDESFDTDDTFMRLILAMEYKALMLKSGKSVVPTVIVNAYLEGNLFTDHPKLIEDMGLDEGDPETAPSGSVFILQNGTPKLEEKDKDRGVIEIRDWQLVDHMLLSLSPIEWSTFFKSLTPQKDEEDKTIFRLPCNYHVWLQWEGDYPEIINPEYKSRLIYYAEGAALGGVLISPEDMWGNTLLTLLRTRLSRNSFGSLLRVRATDLVTPTQTYGNKSTYNAEVEISKPGILRLKPTWSSKSPGISISFENNPNIDAVANAYRLLNELKIVNFPQHQGKDLRSGYAALAANVSLLEMDGIKFYLFGRTVDKVTKLFNRLSLLNRVGTTGETFINLDDM